MKAQLLKEEKVCIQRANKPSMNTSTAVTTRIQEAI